MDNCPSSPSSSILCNVYPVTLDINTISSIIYLILIFICFVLSYTSYILSNIFKSFDFPTQLSFNHFMCSFKILISTSPLIHISQVIIPNSILLLLDRPLQYMSYHLSACLAFSFLTSLNLTKPYRCPSIFLFFAMNTSHTFPLLLKMSHKSHSLCLSRNLQKKNVETSSAIRHLFIISIFSTYTTKCFLSLSCSLFSLSLNFSLLEMPYRHLKINKA